MSAAKQLSVFDGGSTFTCCAVLAPFPPFPQFLLLDRFFLNPISLRMLW